MKSISFFSLLIAACFFVTSNAYANSPIATFSSSIEVGTCMVSIETEGNATTTLDFGNLTKSQVVSGQIKDFVVHYSNCIGVKKVVLGISPRGSCSMSDPVFFSGGIVGVGLRLVSGNFSGGWLRDCNATNQITQDIQNGGTSHLMQAKIQRDGGNTIGTGTFETIINFTSTYE